MCTKNRKSKQIEGRLALDQRSIIFKIIYPPPLQKDIHTLRSNYK